MSSNSCQIITFAFQTLSKGMDSLIHLVWVKYYLFFCKNNLCIKNPTKFDMPLNEETKPNKTKPNFNIIYII